MKTKLLFVTLMAVFGLASCVSTSSQDDGTTISQNDESSTSSQDDGSITNQDDGSTSNQDNTSSLDEEPVNVESSLEEMLSAADSFSEQDYKTLSYEMSFSYDIESDDLDKAGITSATVSYYEGQFYDASTSGDYYAYMKTASTSISSETAEYRSTLSETEIVFVDNVYKLVYVTNTSASLSDYSGSLEEELKYQLDLMVSVLSVDEDDINEVNSKLSNPSYYKSDDSYTIKGETTIGNVSGLSSYIRRVEYDYEGIGSQKLDEDYLNASVDYEYSFNEYGNLLKEEAVVRDPISYTLTVISGSESKSYEVDMVNITYYTKLTYDEEIERANLYETYIANAD